jgi:hypothetical protein
MKMKITNQQFSIHNFVVHSYGNYCLYLCHIILGLQSFPRECEDKDMAAMLVPQTKEANEKSFVNVLQHGGYDVTCNQIITLYNSQMVLNPWSRFYPTYLPTALSVVLDLGEGIFEYLTLTWN